MTDRRIQWSYLFHQRLISADDHVRELHQPDKLLRIAQEYGIIQINHQPLTGFLESLFHVKRRVVKDLAVNEYRVKSLQLCPQPVPPADAALQQLAGAKTHPRKVVVLLRKAVCDHRAMPVRSEVSEIRQNAKSSRRDSITG